MAEKLVVRNSVIVIDLKGTLVPNTDDSCIRINAQKLFQGYRRGGNSLFVTASAEEVLHWGYPQFLARIGWVKAAMLAPKGNNDGKSYKAVAEAAGLGTEDAAKRMVIVGSSFRDRPNDLDGVVSVVQPDGYLFDALILSEIVAALYKRGQGNFQIGFEGWMNKGQQSGTRSDPFIELELNESVRLHLRRMTAGAGFHQMSNPVVEILAPDRRRSPNRVR